MISALSVVCPSDLLSRESIPVADLEAFDRVTGIYLTRRSNMASATLVSHALYGILDLCGNLCGDVKAVIVVTQSPDRLSPCMAIDVAERMNLPAGIPVFDVNQSCGGFVYGLWLAKRMFLSGKVLLVCVDKLRTAGKDTESLIFSDAACAAIVEAEWEPEGGLFFNDPHGATSLYKTLTGTLIMDGGAVFDFVTKNVPPLIRQYDRTNGPFDFLAGHQANLSMMKLVERRAGFEGRSLHCINDYGNMSMVSIPMTLAANESKILGKQVLLCGYGAGFSAALLGIKWASSPVCKITEV